MGIFSPKKNVFSDPVEDRRPRRRIVLTIVLSVVALVAGSAFSWFRSQQSASVGPTSAAPVITTTGIADTPSTSTKASVPTATTVPASKIGTNAPYQSENFRVGGIAVGGEMTLSVNDSNPAPLSIDAVRGEAFTATGKSGSKLVITWETNKPARSEISYGKGIGQAEAVISETQYGTNHSVIIPDVTPATTYIYVISATDKWGGSAQSNPYAVYTGAKVVSLFDLLAGAVGEVFGWAVKK